MNNPRRLDQLEFRHEDGDVIVQTQDGEAIRLSGAAAVVFRAADGSRNVVAIHDAVCTEVASDTPREVVFAALDHLADLGLLTERAAPPASSFQASRRNMMKWVGTAAAVTVMAPVARASDSKEQEEFEKAKKDQEEKSKFEERQKEETEKAKKEQEEKSKLEEREKEEHEKEKKEQEEQQKQKASEENEKRAKEEQQKNAEEAAKREAEESEKASVPSPGEENAKAGQARAQEAKEKALRNQEEAAKRADNAQRQGEVHQKRAQEHQVKARSAEQDRKNR